MLFVMKGVSPMRINEFLESPKVSWLNGEADDTDVVLSSRVRLARNFEDLKFPNQADHEERLNVLKWVSDSQKPLEKEMKSKFSFFHLF